MKRQIRRNVFETNSSSMHSLTISGFNKRNKFLPLAQDGKVHVRYGTFVGGGLTLTTPIEKLSYVITARLNLLEEIKELVKDYTGKEMVTEPSNNKYYPEGVLENHLGDILEEHGDDPESLKELIFNERYQIKIGTSW